MPELSAAARGAGPWTASRGWFRCYLCQGPIVRQPGGRRGWLNHYLHAHYQPVRSISVG